MSKGLFVVFDGPDFSGKTILINHYSHRMYESGFDVQICKAIGEGETGMAIRNILLNFKNEKRMNPISEYLLFIAAMKESYESVVKPGVAAGRIMVMDRYIYSTFIYQTLYTLKCVNNKTLSVDNTDLMSVMNLIKNMPIPDITAICKIGKSTMLQNRESRGIPNFMDNFCVDNANAIIKEYNDLPDSILHKHNFHYIVNSRPYPKKATQLDSLIAKSKATFEKKNG